MRPAPEFVSRSLRRVASETPVAGSRCSNCKSCACSDLGLIFSSLGETLLLRLLRCVAQDRRLNLSSQSVVPKTLIYIRKEGSPPTDTYPSGWHPVSACERPHNFLGICPIGACGHRGFANLVTLFTAPSRLTLSAVSGGVCGVRHLADGLWNKKHARTAWQSPDTKQEPAARSGSRIGHRRVIR
jgi:hypothetical protein